MNSEEIYKVLEQLHRVCGFTGESGTEALFAVLSDAFSANNVAEMSRTLEESHEEGLCYNMLWPMADKIAKARQTLFNYPFSDET